MDEFVIRSYAKCELALVYFPTASSSHTAVNMLMRWIYQNKKLMEELTSLGYKRDSKWFKPREVRAIVKHLGEPELEVE